MGTRVYKYGAVPLGGDDVLDTGRKTLPKEASDELFKANRLWNNLVELHFKNRQDYRELREKAYPKFKNFMEQIDAKNKALEKAYQAKRTARMKASTRDADHPLIEAANKKIADLKNERKQLYEEMKPLREVADKRIGEKRKTQLNKNFNKAVNEVTKVKNSQLGNELANAIKRDFERARKKAFKDRNSELQFHKFDGTGYWHYEHCLREKDIDTGKQKAVNGTTLPKLLLGNKEWEEDDRAFILKPKHQKGKRMIYELRAKLAGGAKKDSKIYGRFDVIMHRPIPDDAQIRNIKLNRYRTGDKFTYAVNFTVKLPDPKPRSIPDYVIGVDLGFRKFFEEDGRIRIAAIATSDPKDSNFSFIELTTSDWQSNDALSTCSICQRKGHNSLRSGSTNNFLRRMEYIDCLKSNLDDSATKLGEKIIPLIKKMPPMPEEERDKWPARINRMRNWNQNITLSLEDAYKMYKWTRRETEKATLLDVKVYHALQEWWQTYSLKYREMHNLRRKALADRKEYYRIEAAKLVAHGVPIIFEKLNLQYMAKVKDADNKLGNKARSQRFIGSPSEFKDAVKNAAKREGVFYLEVPPQYTSKKCSDCGVINKKLAAEPEWTCQHCGVIHDRDINAAINIAQKGQKKLHAELKKSK